MLVTMPMLRLPEYWCCCVGHRVGGYRNIALGIAPVQALSRSNR